MNIEVYSACKGEHLRPRIDIIQLIDPGDPFKVDVMNAKIPKVLSHIYFPKADYTIWIDNNVTLKKRPEKYIELLDGYDVGVFKHWTRDCLYDEAEECMLHGLDAPERIIPQVRRYKEYGFPKNAGLGMCFLIVRKNTKLVESMNKAWWAEICIGSHRDQISFPFVFTNFVKYFDLPEQGSKNDNEWFRRIV